MKFQSTVAGWVAGVQFYKGAGNGGTHTGSLWTSSGMLLATGTFTNETASGWQTMTFTNPVQISADTTYVVSYFDPNGHYSFEQDLFDWPLKTPPLIGLKASYIDPTGGNGVFNMGGPGFPTATFNGSNYAVDVIFDTTQPVTPPAVTTVTPSDGSSGNPVSTAPTATFSQAVLPGTVSFTVTASGGGAVAGSVGFNGADTVATFTPDSPLAAGTTYTATVSGAQNSSGTPMSGPKSWSFTTSASSQCPCSIWQNAAPSGAVDAADTSAVNLGVQFRASSDGTIAGVRFYKEPDNTGAHTGSLWTSGGTLLATGTFSGESASGWQELDFSTPVPVTAGTTYVASYHTGVGHYAITANGLASAVANGPLTALASGGVYAYGSGNVFPSSSFNASNYWVDVVYTQSAGVTPPAVTTVTPSDGSSGNPVSTAPTATFSQAVLPGTVSFTVTASGGGAVAGSVGFNGADTVATFTPDSPLAAGTTYTATVSGAQNSSGTPMSGPKSWSFTTSASSQCPCSIWQNAAPSGAVDAADTSAVNLGVQFRASSDGTIAGVRFYKEPDNTGAHTGSLWTSGGTLLATGTFSGESASGWQELDFSTPVPVTAGTTYVASYHTGVGHYAITANGLASAVANGPLTALASGGVYAYGSGNVFPSSSFNASNYWVDVVYTQSAGVTPPAVTTVTPSDGSSGNPVSTAPTATFSQAVLPGTVSFTVTASGGGAVAGSVGFNGADTVATFTPDSPLAAGTTYTATVSGAQNSSGTPMSGPKSWSFTTSASSQCPCSIWQNAAPSGAVDAADTSAVNLGVQFRASSDGTIAGVRFYKEPDNTGAHTGSLWTSGGTLLATGTFSGESASGWQELDFSTPVPVTAGTTYVASYHTGVGHYAITANGLASAVANGPLTALASGGVYAYGSGNVFPSSSFNASNYWVDVVYTQSAGVTPPAVTTVTPSDGSSGNPVSTAPTATFSQAVLPGTVSFTVTASGGGAVAGSVGFNGADTVATFTPDSPLAAGTTYTATVSGAQNSSGTPMSGPKSWSFTTSASSQCPCSIWPDTAQPSVASASDPGPVNLGVKFTADTSGSITGIRFYKGAGNTGTHVGSLWTASGTLLGQVTFTGETATGWQEADFSSPIPVTAGTTYIASYYAPNGGYSYDPAAFASAGVDTPPLHAPQSSAVSGGNGVYLYGSSPALPTDTYNATNYWVDVVFTTTSP